MKRLSIILLLLTAVAPCERALGQQVEERMDNGRRVCVYRGARSILSGNDTVVAVPAGSGASCPLDPPLQAEGSPPPTAGLLSQDASPSGRTCIYEQSGARWSVEVPLTQYCPPAAGMLAKSGDRGRS